MPPWWNWQTRRTQNPVVVIPCRFDSDRRHQKKNASYLLRSFSFVRFSQILFDFICLFHHPRGGILASLVAFALFVRSAKWLRTRTQNPVVAIPCRFDSDRRQPKKLNRFRFSFCLIVFSPRIKPFSINFSIINFFSCEFNINTSCISAFFQ